MPEPMRIALAALALFAATLPAAAGATAWQELAPGVRIRMISDDVRKPDGTTMLGLEIEMPANTKTYWRIPGEGGIPAEFDLAGSRGITTLDPVWPYPSIDRTGGYTDFVYFGPTVLPLTAHLEGDAPSLEADVTLGICSDICMPANARFSLPLDFARNDPAEQIRIAQAVSLAPIAWTGPADAIGPVALDASGNTLEVALGGAAIDPASVIADMGPAGMLFGAPQKSPDGRVVSVPLLGGGDAGSLQGQTVRLTFMTEAGAYETTRVIGPSGHPAASQ